MKDRKMVSGWLLFLFIAVLSTNSYAVSDLNVQVCGTPVNISSGVTEAVLSENNGDEKLYADCNIGIAGINGNPAKVRTSDAGQDKIWLENAVIRATSGSVNGDIVYWATFDAPPTALEVSVEFRRFQTGNLKRGNNAATQDWFEISAWIEGNEIYQAERKTITCSPPTCATINIPMRTEAWNPPSMDGPREMMGQFWFYLKLTNDKLTLNSVAVDSQGGGGGGTPDSIANDPSITSGGIGDGKAKCVLEKKGGKKRDRQRMICEMAF